MSVSLISPVLGDNAPPFLHFGTVLGQPSIIYQLGDVVKATFQGADPRNNLCLEGTFAAVERLGKNGTWMQVADDADCYLVYTWRRTSPSLKLSEVDITWDTSGNAEPGTYRFRSYEDAKTIAGTTVPFVGTSNPF